ncbi:alpha/beta hydrolase [Nocardioides terrisoli]|uniref:alpha/beta hydrolase n=1 Tax=Nocardioides terrisoli TaxID=3388267 RepID=UPI00287B6EBF|nr:alpha/beta hydrolase [Nocardioides marmorisolisilvae]
MPTAFTVRQAVLAALAANAVKPLNTAATAVPAFAAGWLTSELAPQLLVAATVDTLVSSRRHRASRTGVAFAAATAAGLAWVITRAQGTGAIVETSLREGAGVDYLDLLDTRPTAEDLKTPLRTLARPFKMADPGVEVLRDIAYTAGGRKAKLDIYRPKDVDLHGAPVLIQVHGGGWTIGKKEEQGLLLMNRMAARGWVCVAINYRLAPKYPFPTQIVDVKRAIAWVRDHIASYGGSPDYLVLTGGSAGGHLSALAALTPGDFQPGFEDADTSVAGCVPFYGVYDWVGDDGDRFTVGLRDKFLAGRVYLPDPKAHLDEYRAASPLHRITPDAPDFFVIHGANDTLVSVRQARAFVARLREVSKATVTYAELPGTQHAFEVFGSIRSHTTIKAVQRWLEWHRATWLREMELRSPLTGG